MDAIKQNMGALYQLNTCRRVLTPQQYKTLRGQIMAGDAEGATRGLEKIMERKARAHMDKVLLSSGKDDWETPADLFKELDEEFKFTLDAAASDDNHKLPRYYTAKTDGLVQSWAGERVFCNPPYSRKTKNNPGQEAWIRKALAESQKGALVVMLIPSRTDTSAFHECILPYAEIRFLKGRLRFEDKGQPRDAAPFPSMVCIFRPKEESDSWME